MRPAIRYVADDGREFTTQLAAEAHDELIEACARAIAPLGSRDHKGLDSGAGYIQHDPRVFVEVKRRLLVHLATHFPSYGFDKLNAADVHPMSGVGRVASEGPAPLAKAWGRLGCIDEQAREWEQPYFVLNPGKGKNVCVEDRRPSETPSENQK